MDILDHAVRPDRVLSLVKQALTIADERRLLDVAISSDEARVALEGPEADDVTLRALEADWLDDQERADLQLATAPTIMNAAT